MLNENGTSFIIGHFCPRSLAILAFNLVRPTTESLFRVPYQTFCACVNGRLTTITHDIFSAISSVWIVTILGTLPFLFYFGCSFSDLLNLSFGYFKYCFFTKLAIQIFKSKDKWNTSILAYGLNTVFLIFLLLQSNTTEVVAVSRKFPALIYSTLVLTILIVWYLLSVAKISAEIFFIGRIGLSLCQPSQHCGFDSLYTKRNN